MRSIDDCFEIEPSKSGCSRTKDANATSSISIESGPEVNTLRRTNKGLRAEIQMMTLGWDGRRGAEIGRAHV